MSHKALSGQARERPSRAPAVDHVQRIYPGEFDEVSRVVATLDSQLNRQRAGEDDDDDDAGVSWRAVAGLRNPYEEGGADDYLASLVPPSLASLVAQAQGDPSPRFVLSVVRDGIAHQGVESAPIRAGLPLPRFPMSPTEESVFDEIPDIVVPTHPENDRVRSRS